jgi:uncharacterized protein
MSTLLHVCAYISLAPVLMAVDGQGSLDHDTSILGEPGRTALHWAAEMGHDETAKLLFQMGSAANAQDSLHNSLLHIATAEGYDRMVEILLEVGADPNMPGQSQEPPLHLAARVGCARVVEMLLACHADANCKLPDQTISLYLAAQWGNTSTVVELLLAGVDVSFHKTFGESALHAAVRNGHGGAALTLLESGAIANAPTSYQPPELEVNAPASGRRVKGNKWTPLHIASFRGRRQMGEILFLHGANPASRILKGNTPLQVAEESHNEVMTELRINVDLFTYANSILQAAIQCRSQRLMISTLVDPSLYLDVRMALVGVHACRID